MGNGYIESQLGENEKLIYTTRPHKIIFVSTAILWLLAIMLIRGEIVITRGGIGGIVSGEGTAIMRGIGAFCIIIGLLPVIRYLTSEFGITDKRVIIKVGWIRRNTLETQLKKIEQVRVDRGIFGRIFNYGTIVIVGTGGSSSPFRGIRKPMEFRKYAQAQKESVKCPYCGETIKLEAIKCKHCKSSLPEKES